MRDNLKVTDACFYGIEQKAANETEYIFHLLGEMETMRGGSGGSRGSGRLRQRLPV